MARINSNIFSYSSGIYVSKNTPLLSDIDTTGLSFVLVALSDMDQIDKTQGVYKWSSYTDPNAVKNIDTAFKRGLFCGVAVQMRFGAEYIRTDANPEESPSWKAINYELSQNKVEGKSFQFIVLMCNSKACGSGDTDTNIWEALAFYRNLFVKHYPKTQVFIGMDKDFWELRSPTVATRFFHSSQSTPLVVFGNEDPLIVTDNLNSFPYTDNMPIYTPASFKTSDGLFAFVGVYKMGGLRYSLIKWFGNEQNMIDKLGFTPVNYSTGETTPTTPTEPEPEEPEEPGAPTPNDLTAVLAQLAIVNAKLDRLLNTDYTLIKGEG